MQTKEVFCGFSVSDLDEAKRFYTEVIGLVLEDEHMGLKFRLPGGGHLFVYPKSDHQPASYTVLNVVVDDIESSVDKLVSKGVQFEKYDGNEIKTDDKGIARGTLTGQGPDIAWFKDPSGNFISIIQASETY